MLNMSRHAEWRKYTRGITDDELAAALASEPLQLLDGSERYYDPASRTTLAVKDGIVKSIYRTRKKVLKQRYSR